MDKFIKAQLLEDENIEYNGKLSKCMFILPFVFSLFIIGLPFLIKKFVDYKTTDFIITNKRIMIKKGMINRTIEEQMLNKIETVQVWQSFIGSLFNYGDVTISGTGGSQILIKRIGDLFEFKKNIVKQTEKV